MKIYTVIILVMFILLTIVFDIENLNASLPLTGKIIIIDPGHGGEDPGTLSGSILEKDLNLQISFYIEEELSKFGATVILTRDGDYDLSKPNATWRKRSDFDNRINLINNSDANLYLSIHMNYLNDSSYSGPQIFYKDNDKSLAQSIQEDLNNALDTNREVRNIPDETYMYSKLDIKGLLIECGFLSNSEEKQLLASEEYQRKIAIIIANSLKDSYNLF